MKKYSAYIAVFVILTFLLSSLCFAKEKKMTIKEYRILLQQFMDHDSVAQAQIAIERAKIEELKARYKLTEEEIARIQQEIYDMLGAWEADVENFKSELRNLQNQISALRNLTPEVLFQRQDEVEQVEEKYNALKENKIALLQENQAPMANIENGLEELKTKIDLAPRSMTYTVKKGDYLWKIAGMPDIYGDPYKWPRIWSANAESISDPNLIYPDQLLKIITTLEPGQRLVVKGDYLSRIAAAADVYGDPFAWTKIYEANKNQIEDPNIIYPEQILVIPGK